jgi:hypothetical protein
MIKPDVDAAIRQSMTERRFFENLKRASYAVKIGNRGPRRIKVYPMSNTNFSTLRTRFCNKKQEIK